MSSVTRLATLGRRVLGSKCSNTIQPSRKMGGGTWHYREDPKPTPKFQQFYAAAVGFICIFWSGYMTYNHFGHIVGEFPTIEPSQWTDEELGIPPDDEDIYPEGYVPIAQRT